jgi:hypothetical protein
MKQRNTPSEPLVEQPADVARSRLRYGINEATGWRDFATGPHQDQIRDHLRSLQTQIVRIYAFDSWTPHPVSDWPAFARYVNAVLKAGATPMITFVRFRPPFGNTRMVQWFARRCGDLVWACIDEWGGDVVRDWYWCVWDEPNSSWTNPGFTFELYQQIYLEVAHEILRWIAPYLHGRRILIGGPAIDTFQPFWVDWLWRFVHEIDNTLIGFLLWHQFGEWRAPGEWGAPQEPMVYRRLIMKRTRAYLEQATTVQRLVSGRRILNICGRLNTSSHHEPRVSCQLNQTIFGAAFYAAALIQLVRGGVDGELYWMGTGTTNPYGLWDEQAHPTPTFHAKRLVTQAIRYGDEIIIDDPPADSSDLLMVQTRGIDGRRSVLAVHLSNRKRQYCLGDMVANALDYDIIRKVDSDSPTQIVTSPRDGTIVCNGFGIAVATTALAD